MPIFEDTRKFKLPTLSGFDIFQTHVKKAADHLKQQQNDLIVARLQHNIPKPFEPSAIVQGSPTVGASDALEDNFDGRVWIIPRITDFNCATRLVTHAMIPASLPTFQQHYTAANVAALSGAPLDVRRQRKPTRAGPGQRQTPGAGGSGAQKLTCS